jgi:hypothetical protein
MADRLVPGNNDNNEVERVPAQRFRLNPVNIRQVVKVLTIDGEETVLDPEFVEVCSDVKNKVQGDCLLDRISSSCICLCSNLHAKFNASQRWDLSARSGSSWMMRG